MIVRALGVVLAAALTGAACGGGAPAGVDGPVALDASADLLPAEDGGEDAPPLFPDGPTGDGGPALDSDGDGIADADEERLMRDYLPFLSLDPDDGCPRMGIVYRLRPHPQAATLVHATVVMLYENDCGAAGHVGDNEAFGLTIDPAVDPPAGILAVRTISHRDTACEVVSTCGSCGGLDACTTATRNSAAYPVVFASKDKHGNYVFETGLGTGCDGACFLTNWCTLRSDPVEPPLVNVGEPDQPLVTNLTTQGFITATNGWTASELLDFDPWADVDFGGAGNVRSDFFDDRFVTPTCQ